MRAVVFDQFAHPPEVQNVPDPQCPADGVVVEVVATGLCRSDWHGWQGHDGGIALPHVPGHELAGLVVEVGSQVTSWSQGDRVTTPFVCACGQCPTCRRGDHQVCERQLQPGFTQWGSFAEFVALPRAEVNLVRLPSGWEARPDIDEYDVAAALGCRFATAYRAVVELAMVQDDDWVVVHGCGGVGLSAVMIAAAHGARVIALDVATPSLERAVAFGAIATLNSGEVDVVAAVRDLTGGGADVSVDALGAATTMQNSLACLRPRGTHVQVGLLAGADARPPVPMDVVIGSELRVLGSHGMAATSYPRMMAEIAEGRLRPDLLIRERINLDQAPARLAALNDPGAGAGGMTIIRPGG